MLTGIKALTCDVYGTCVDVRGSLLRDAPKIDSRLGADFVDTWIRGYAKDFRGEWRYCDWMLSRAAVAAYLSVSKAGEPLDDWSAVSLPALWRVLTPWPDVRRGIWRLNNRFETAMLSNGDAASLQTLNNMSVLGFRRVLSAEHCRAFKPRPEFYQYAIQELALDPHEILMVASHKFDLNAAAKMGFRTAFVPRPYEWGGAWKADELEPDDSFDIVATGFDDLAEQLGC